MEKIYYKKELIAIRVKSFKKGSHPLTPEGEALQLLTAKHLKGRYIQAHLHSLQKRITNNLQECLIVIKGKIKIDLYGKDKKYFKSIQIKAGELAILFRGGHGVRFLEDSEVYEIKTGPFIDDKILI